ncbi:disulfide bond formation protein B [Acinetobacter sp. HY1485]|uniref:disulfide bond formation protein B n=1 Tax=Acinetobacter sp. HY1485 TaxID=2970918 RepID=UPI0022B94488|nr:disulfide bond formation protein B [Acinetobacter sp. HY1485]
MNLSYRLVSGLVLLASIVGMAFALYLEHFKGLQPCPLCIFQRVGLMVMGLFAFLGFVHNPKNTIVKRIYAGLASLGILWSAGVAARHVWIQHLPPSEVPSCGPGLNYLVDVLPLKEVLSQVLTGSGECAKIDWTFLGQSMPVWSLVFFSFLLLVCLWQVFRKY